jgi:hypothetical protein
MGVVTQQIALNQRLGHGFGLHGIHARLFQQVDSEARQGFGRKTFKHHIVLIMFTWALAMDSIKACTARH